MAYILFILSPFLYLVIWILVCWAIIRYLLKPKNNKPESKQTRRIVGIVLLVVWIVWSFWEAGGKILYYNAQVDEMCAKDGGIKVYETVTLPPDKFSKWGMVKFYRPTQNEMALGPEYIFKEDKYYYKRGSPKLIRHHYEVVRRADRKLLGETTSYGRGGVISLVHGSLRAMFVLT